MLKKNLSLLLTFLSLCSTFSLEGRHVYDAFITVDAVTAKASATCLLNLVQDIRTSSLEQLIPFYNPNDPTSFGFNLRGLQVNAFFPANSTELFVTSPEVGITQNFQGATRDESLSLFKEYFTNNALKSKGFLKAHARLTPIDPMAGNPNSLMAQMGQADFALGRLSLLSGCGCWSAQPIVNQFQLGVNYDRGFSKGYDMTLVSFPLRYSYSPDYNWAFILDAPIAVLSTGGSYSVFGSVGLGVRIPITRDWSLTPTFRSGFGGSIDMNCGSFFASPGILSNLQYPIQNFVLGMTNFIGYYCSGPLHVGGVNADYHLHNWVVKNGLYLTSCDGFAVCGRSFNFDLFITDSYFGGDKLFIEHYDEVGISLITTNVLPWLDYDALSIGFSYQFGEKGWKGYSINTLYQF